MTGIKHRWCLCEYFSDFFNRTLELDCGNRLKQNNPAHDCFICGNTMRRFSVWPDLERMARSLQEIKAEQHQRERAREPSAHIKGLGGSHLRPLVLSMSGHANRVFDRTSAIGFTGYFGARPLLEDALRSSEAPWPRHRSVSLFNLVGRTERERKVADRVENRRFLIVTLSSRHLFSRFLCG